MSENARSMVRVVSFSNTATNLPMWHHYTDAHRGICLEYDMAGIPEENIDVINECTYCNPDKYFSHRYSKGHRGNYVERDLYEINIKQKEGDDPSFVVEITIKSLIVKIILSHEYLNLNVDFWNAM